MSTREPTRTVHAQQAFELSDLFGYKFNPLRFGERRPRRVKLKLPDGPSTAGGLHARQSFLLVTDDEPPESIVCGWLDSNQLKSEVKSYGAIDEQFRQRFGRPCDLEQIEYEKFVHELRGFLKVQKIDLVVTDAATAPPQLARSSAPTDPAHPVPPPEVSASSLLLFVMLGLGIVIGFGLGYLVFG